MSTENRDFLDARVRLLIEHKDKRIAYLESVIRRTAALFDAPEMEMLFPGVRESLLKEVE